MITPPRFEEDEGPLLMLNMIKYSNAEAFKVMAESNTYPDMVKPLRVAALENHKLLMTRKVEY